MIFGIHSFLNALYKLFMDADFSRMTDVANAAAVFLLPVGSCFVL